LRYRATKRIEHARILPGTGFLAQLAIQFVTIAPRKLGNRVHAQIAQIGVDTLANAG